jgi:hypothetical protein
MELSTHTAKGVDKVKRYGWTMKDKPGTLTMLHKDTLQVHPAYQRELVEQKVKQITAEWSWIACGALIVGKRGGEYWVIDGQHRAMGAKRRSDIEQLPCLVFETEGVKQEAQGFLDVNTGRKPITSTGRHKAMVAAGNDTASFIQAQIDALGLQVKGTSGRAGNLKCIGWCMKRASEDRERFTRVLTLVAEMANKDGIFVPERVLEGVWILDSKCGDGLADKRLVQRLKDKGAQALLDAAGRAAAFYNGGGGKIWAQGMLAELNKGLQRKFTLEAVEA